MSLSMDAALDAQAQFTREIKQTTALLSPNDQESERVGPEDFHGRNLFAAHQKTRSCNARLVCSPKYHEGLYVYL